MSQTLNELDQKLATEIKWKEPRHAYVAFRARKCAILREEEKLTELEKETGLRAYDTIVDLNVRGVHRQKDKIAALMRTKKWKVAAWGKFPLPESIEARMTKNSSADADDWQILDQFLRSEYSGQAKESKEIQGMKAKVAELEAKLEKSTKKGA